MTRPETIVLNSISGGSASIRRRFSAKTGRASKDRVTIEIESEPLVHMFDDTALGAGPAQAIRDKVEQAIKSITAQASASTIARRKRAYLDLSGGGADKATRQRYTGGRIGTKLPTGSTTLFNDSGRLADGLFTRQNPSEGNWTTNVPANRFTPDTQHLVGKLFDLIGNQISSSALLSDIGVRRALRDSLDQLLVKAKNETDIKRQQLQLAQMNVAKKLLAGAIRLVA